MKKIKVIENDKIIAFDFHAAILKDNILFRICNELNLTDVYIDIFGIEIDFSKELIKKNSTLKLFEIDSGGWSISAAINDIPKIVEILSNHDFSDLNIWDAYIDWEQYLKTKTIYKTIPSESESKVYLNYNPLEKHKVELYLETIYEADKIRQKLEEIIS